MPTLTAGQIYHVCLQAGFTPDQAVTWTAIALAESSGNTAAHNPRGEDSWGLWQINVAPHVRTNHWGDLTDPLVNARAAYEISGGGTNLRPWTVTHASNQGTDRDYRNFMDEAQAAVGGAYAGDFSGVSGYHDPSPGGADMSVMAAAPFPGAVAPTVGPDTDADGALDAFEMSSGTDPQRPDSDDDGLTDGFELLSGTNPLAVDTDDDGVGDMREVRAGTDPHVADTDADGMRDAMELAAGRDPLDGLPADPTDGAPDGTTDGGSGAGDPAGTALDSDDDGLSNTWETSHGTDPTQADSDQDGMPDALEQAGGTNPLLPDSDTDGVLDGVGGEPPSGTSDEPPPSRAAAQAPYPAWTMGPSSPMMSPPAYGATPFPGVPTYGQPTDGGTTQQFLDAAVAQAGDRYVYGAEAGSDDPNPDAFDCSELTQWAAAQVGVELPDGSWMQYLELREQGAVIPVDQALHTPGALVFHFDREPVPGGGRPGDAHVAISLGDGRTIEARGRELGVGTWEAGDRFTYAAVVPGLSGNAAVPSAEALSGLPLYSAGPLDSDTDGVTDVFEMSTGTNPYVGDSDMDGLTDGFEVLVGSDTVAMGIDTDGDGLSDGYETQVGTATMAVDSDGDGLSDPVELAAHGDQPEPLLLDSDDDGLSDAWEASLGSDAHAADSDDDGLADALEVVRGTSPRDPDSDDDGFVDDLDDD